MPEAGEVHEGEVVLYFTYRAFRLTLARSVT